MSVPSHPWEKTLDQVTKRETFQGVLTDKSWDDAAQGECKDYNDYEIVEQDWVEIISQQLSRVYEGGNAAKQLNGNDFTREKLDAKDSRL